MRRIGDWAVALATLMATVSVGIKVLADEPRAGGPGVAQVAPAAPTAPALQPRLSPASPPDVSSQQAPASGYVGAETCVGCHTGYDGTVAKTKHGFKGNSRTPMAQQGCESCHGPGEAHASDPETVKPMQFDKVAAPQANA